jgi:hypothetical protein
MGCGSSKHMDEPIVATNALDNVEYTGERDLAEEPTLAAEEGQRPTAAKGRQLAKEERRLRDEEERKSSSEKRRTLTDELDASRTLGSMSDVPQRKLTAAEELCLKRFAHAYLQALVVQQQSKDCGHTPKVLKRRNYSCGDGEDAPGFPDGGLAMLALLPLSAARKELWRRSPRMAMPMWIAVNAQDDAAASQSVVSGGIDKLSTNIYSISLQEAYNRRFGDKPPWLHVILKANSNKRRAVPAQNPLRAEGDAQGDALIIVLFNI